MARHLKVTARGNVIVVAGWKAGELMKHAGVKGVYSGASKGWLIDQRRLPDLVAYAEYQNITVRIINEEVA